MFPATATKFSRRKLEQNNFTDDCARDCHSLVTPTKKICVRCRTLITHSLILQKPRPPPVLRKYGPNVRLCTTRVAVTHSLLDRTKTSRSNFACSKNSFA